MLRYQNLNNSEQKKIKDLASLWFSDHKTHVEKLLTNTKENVSPSGSDLYHPELWKDVYWNWFFNLKDKENGI